MFVIRLVAPSDPNGNSRVIDLLVSDRLVGVEREENTRRWKHINAVSISVTANEFKKWLKHCQKPIGYYTGRSWE